MINLEKYSSTMEQAQITLRQEVVAILYKKFGNKDDIYECADEWSKEQSISNGVVAYYKAYYNK